MERMLGSYIKDLVDERDLKWEDHDIRSLMLQLPSRRIRGGMGPALDQGDTSMCVCYSTASIKMEDERRETGKLWLFDPIELYQRCKAVDGIPNVEGTYLRVALKIAQQRGVLSVRPQKKFFKVGEYVRLADLQHIKEALVVDGPVVFGMDVDSGIFNAPNGVLREPTGQGAGGHAMVIAGYDDNIKFKNWKNPGGVWIKNSWGKEWGRSGYAWMPYSWFKAYNEFDAWKVVDAKNV